jgi:hypothetical protein
MKLVGGSNVIPYTSINLVMNLVGRMLWLHREAQCYSLHLHKLSNEFGGPYVMVA